MMGHGLEVIVGAGDRGVSVPRTVLMYSGEKDTARLIRDGNAVVIISLAVFIFCAFIVFFEISDPIESYTSRQ